MLADFHWIRPWWLLALLPLALLLWRLVRTAGSDSQWREAVDPALLELLLVKTETRSRRGPLILLGLAWLLAVLALAGPSWQRQEVPAYRNDTARVLVLDLSRSMDATDLAPNRLARAKHKLADLLTRSADGQTALVVFAAAPYVLSPLTDDADTIVAMLGALNTSLPPAQGGRLDRAIGAARVLLSNAAASGGEVIAITDATPGESALAAAQRLLDAGHRLHILGIGTERGAPVPLPGGGLLEDASGAIVMPKLEATPLAELAATGGGRYASLSADDSDLDRLLSSGLELAARRGESRQTEHWVESGPWLLLPLLGLALLAIRRGLC